MAAVAAVLLAAATRLWATAVVMTAVSPPVMAVVAALAPTLSAVAHAFTALTAIAVAVPAGTTIFVLVALMLATAVVEADCSMPVRLAGAASVVGVVAGLANSTAIVCII